MSFSFPYQPYVSQFYADRPDLEQRPYEEQSAALVADRFPGASDGLAAHLAPIGYEVRNVHFTARSAQERWAVENDVAFREDVWQLDIARAQALTFDPDVLVIDPFSVPRSWLHELRADCASLRIVLSRYSAPKLNLSAYEDCDLVISGDRSQVSQLRSLGVDAFLLHHGFDGRILEDLGPRYPRNTIFFSGQLHRSEGFHMYRLSVIRALIDSGLPLRLHVLQAEDGLGGRLKQRSRRSLWTIHQYVQRRPLLSGWASKIPLLKRALSWSHPPAAPLPLNVRRRLRVPLFGIEMYREMRQARVALNSHGDVSASDANNLRLWEAPGVGSCLLTDAKSNMKDLFDVGSEVIVYESAEDCRDKARWLLDNPEKAEEVAASGQRRVLREHTLAHRAEELDIILNRALREGA